MAKAKVKVSASQGRKKHVILSGNPVDGFEIHGPFDTAVEAIEWAGGPDGIDGDWWVAPVHEVRS